MIDGEAGSEQPRLRRVMGPGVLLLFIVGDILGTGVYALIGDVAAEVVGAAWVTFLLAFVIAAITALRPVQQYPLAAISVGSGVLLSLATQVFNRRRAQRARPIDEVAPVGA